jgi:heat-inducible transcriptional repressor
MLTERREQLLRFIVDEYVRSAQPVASSAVVRRYGLPVSSATIRNEMARLEDEGYIVQPHTSAGRIPSDKGYRYYVEALMRPQEPPAAVQQTIRHQFHQAAGETDEWAHLAAAVLAARLSYVSVVTAPHAAQTRLRSLQLVSVHDFVALLVLVLQETLVLQQTLTLDRPLSQDELADVAARLNSLYAGRTVDEIRAMQMEHRSFEAQTVHAALELMQSEEAESFGEAYLEGLRDMLREPEFAQGDRMLALMDLLGRSNLPKAIPLARAAGHQVAPGRGAPQARPGKVTAIIGSEHPQDAMHQCSVVISRYGSPSGLRGTISVVGPTRMYYTRAVSMVRYMSSIMDDLLDAYFG